jgi:hypothetical protein
MKRIKVSLIQSPLREVGDVPGDLPIARARSVRRDAREHSRNSRSVILGVGKRGNLVQESLLEPY